jgi:NTE family protein
LLDNSPLAELLLRMVPLQRLPMMFEQRQLHALAVTASSYTSGVHWTFCQTSSGTTIEPWLRPGRRAEFQPVTIEHLMASSAIPFLFPATSLWVDGHREFFGDGSMRQISPLSPAIHLGADRVLVVGVGQPQRSRLGGGEGERGEPTMSGIAGHAMASVFHDTLQADVEQAQRVTRTLSQLPPEAAALMPYRHVEVMAVQPSQSLDGLAKAYQSHLPRSIRNALGGLGALRGGGALASYLLFEPAFVEALINLGMRDAQALEPELRAFFTNP